MPSSLFSGPLFKFIRVQRGLRVVSGGRLTIEPVEALPDAADREEGDLVVFGGELYIHNGTAFVVAGTQT
jgi:hypothetical protein